MDSLTKSINQSALDFSKKLAESAEGKNNFFFLWGISTSLAMVCLGTEGTTAAQIAPALQFNRDQDIKSYLESEKKRKMNFNLGKVEEIYLDFWTFISEINSPSDAMYLKQPMGYIERKLIHFIISI